MSSNQQILLAGQGGSSGPPVLRCVGDEYYLGTNTDPNFADVSLLLHCDGTNGSTTYVDSSSNSFSVSASVPLTTTNPKFGTAAALNAGGADAIVVSHNAKFNLGSSDFTLEGWFARTSVVGSLRYVLSKGTNTTPSSFAYGFFTDNENFGFSWSDGTSSFTLFHSTFMVTDVYFHWAVVRNGSDIALYIDGVRRADAVISSAINNNTAALRFFEPAFASVSSPARLDEFRFTLGVARYTADFTPPTAEFPDANSGALTVLSLHGEALVDSSVSPKTLTAVGAAGPSSAQSKFGGSSLAFLNTIDAITTPSNSAFNFSADFTIEAWAYILTTEATAQVIATRRAYNTSSSGTWRMADTGWQNLSSGVVTVVSYTVPRNQWTHVAISRQSGTLRAFINGILVASAADTTNYSNTQTLTIGHDSDLAGVNTPLSGYIDDLRVTAGAARYTANFTPLPTVTYCDSVEDQFSGQTNGRDFPRGQSVATQAGTLRVLNPWVKLSGEQIQAQQGITTSTLPNKTAALSGQAFSASQGVTVTPSRTAILSGVVMTAGQNSLAVAPYPRLLSTSISATTTAPGISGSICTLNLQSDGTFSLVGLLGNTISSGAWIDTADPNFAASSISNKYEIYRVGAISVVALEYPTLPANLGSNQVVRVPPSAPRPSSVFFQVVIKPTSTNPRFGETDYYSLISVNINVRNT